MRAPLIRAIATVFCLSLSLPCWAQAPPEQAPVEKSYVASYFVVGLGIALGLATICRPAKRRKEVRRPDA